MAEIKERIKVDIEKFNLSIKKLDKIKLDPKKSKVVELAKMYASDSKSFLDRGDFYTSFSSIAYAHGLLDSILKQEGLIE